MSTRVLGVLLTAYLGYSVLSAGLHLAHRDAPRAAVIAGPMAAASLVVAFGSLASEGVVWVLAAGILVCLAANSRSEK